MGIEDFPEWEKMSLWQKFKDDSITRPEKTWRNRLFWTWPISHWNIKKSVDRPRVEFGHHETSAGPKPYVEIRTTRFKGETYKNIPLDNAIRINWWGWLWGWK